VAVKLPDTEAKIIKRRVEALMFLLENINYARIICSRSSV
jgi:hypothetical protein